MELIERYFTSISDDKLIKIKELGELYKSWNEKINLISRKDIDNIYKHHLLHSLALIKFKKFKPHETVIDMGTGGGLPGIPLAIIFPKVRFCLIDARNNKIKTVDKIIEQLEIKNVSTQHIRIEEIKGYYDYILGRAVTNVESFKILTKKYLKKRNPKSSIYYWTGKDNIKTLKKSTCKTYSLEKLFINQDYYKDKYIVKLN